MFKFSFSIFFPEMQDLSKYVNQDFMSIPRSGSNCRILFSDVSLFNFKEMKLDYIILESLITPDLKKT